MDKWLRELLTKSELVNNFELRRFDDNSKSTSPMVAYRVKSNIYRIRSLELWGNKQDSFFRIYHAPNINENLKSILHNIKGNFKSSKYFSDYKTSDYIDLLTEIRNILNNDDIIIECKNSSNVSKISRFEGLELPDVDVSQEDVMGQVFTWREIISIWEDNSEDNKLKEVLSRNGIYIQRDKLGKSRYIGSACGENGIIGRWMKHLNSNGDAKHLNLFVLEKGYNELLFSVIEFCDEEDILKKENMWKVILGTINYGAYNGLQLNNN